jgi:hypothetical protein
MASMAVLSSQVSITVSDQGTDVWGDPGPRRPENREGEENDQLNRHARRDHDRSFAECRLLLP